MEAAGFDAPLEGEPAVPASAEADAFSFLARKRMVPCFGGRLVVVYETFVKAAAESNKGGER